MSYAQFAVRRQKELWWSRSISVRGLGMRCPSCGAENSGDPRSCRNCGKPLPHPFEADAPESTEPPMADEGSTAGMDERPVDHRDIPGRLKYDYLHGMREQTHRCLDGLQCLLAHFREPRMDAGGILTEAANIISRQFGIDNVAIGLKDPDGLYRYKAMVGLRDLALEGHKQIAYRKEDFFENPHFRGTDISKQSRIYLAEDNVLTEEEKTTFNRPVLLALKRRTVKDSLEGDYIDTKIWGRNEELLGWIEISGTRTMKLPDATTVRWVETIASLVGAALLSSGSVR